MAPDDYDNMAILADQEGIGTLKSSYGNLKVKFNLNKIKLTSFTTFNKSDRNAFGDLDFTAADVLRQDQDSNTKTFNQEIRLGSVSDDSSKLNWDLGMFYQDLDKILITRASADFGFFGPPFEPTGTQSQLAVGDFTNTYKTFAVFGFADYKLTDELTISAGLRYDNISQENRSEGTNPERTDTQLQPKFSLSFQAFENTMMYANYGKGYRTGGFNQGETVRYDTSFKAEITDNYEIGIKNSYLDNRFILNISGYYTDFSNQQLYDLVLNGGTEQILIGNFNVAKSESIEFETDMRIRASNWLNILGSYGLSKSKIIMGTSTTSTGTNETIDVSGNATPLVPQDSYNLGLESSFNVSDKITFNGNINLEGTGEMYWHEDNAPVSPRYSLLNARISLTFNYGFPFFAMSILILATWTSNVMNIYSSGLAFNDLFKLNNAQRSKTTLVVGGVGILLAAFGILTHFMSFITLLTITITPIAGVMISDYYISKTCQETPQKVNWKGVISWGSGVPLMLVMTSQIKNILGIIVAALAYYLLKKNIR
jgi:iron complex outermembrane receptor protein